MSSFVYRVNLEMNFDCHDLHFIFELWIKSIVLIFRMRVNRLKIVY